MSVRIVRHEDPRSFRDRAGAWLAGSEAEHNLILGIVPRLLEGDHHYRAPIYLATVEEDGAVVGCAWRTPPHKLGLTRMPAAAVPALAADAAEVYPSLPAVLGEEGIARAFARAWADLRGVDVGPGMRQRIYELTTVIPPARRPAGEMRRATGSERHLLIRWWEAFRDEAGVGGEEDVAAAVDRRIGRGELVVWDDGRPVCLAGAGSRTPRGVRIGPVYTPPEDRRKGYATALVADLSRRMLDEGREVCFLYTDLSNPTSNSIYREVGYRPVADVVDITFTGE